MTTDIPKTKYGVAVCLFRGKNVYLSQRMWNNLYFSNMWQFIHGYVISDYERYADAAVRVVKEETGIEIAVARFCYIKSFMLSNEFYYTYFVHLKDGEEPRKPTTKELTLHSGYTSFPLERAVGLTLVPGLRKMLKAALKTSERLSAPPIEERNPWTAMCDYDG